MASAPWCGGFYERLVRNIKQPLKKTLGKAKLTYKEMETLLVEVEGIINSRPLIYLYDDDVMDPLTPSHLLVGRNMFIRPHNVNLCSVLVDVSTENLNNRTKYIRKVLAAFWTRFNNCYLSELREHYIYRNRQGKTNEVNVLNTGDVIVIKEEKFTPRSAWRLGRIDQYMDAIKKYEVQLFSQSARPENGRD